MFKISLNLVLLTLKYSSSTNGSKIRIVSLETLQLRVELNNQAKNYITPSLLVDELAVTI